MEDETLNDSPYQLLDLDGVFVQILGPYGPVFTTNDRKAAEKDIQKLTTAWRQAEQMKQELVGRMVQLYGASAEERAAWAATPEQIAAAQERMAAARAARAAQERA